MATASKIKNIITSNIVVCMEETANIKNTLNQCSTCTMRQGCEAGIYLKASDDGKALVITKMTEGHNHEVSQVLYSHLPDQRIITPESKAIVLELMDLKTNKKMIQHKIMNKWKSCYLERFIKHPYYRQKKLFKQQFS